MGIVVVKYQMNWPGDGDIYYTQEGADRRYYYGVSAVPSLFLGGSVATIANPISETDLITPYNNEISKPAFFDLSATHQIDGNKISVQANILPYVNAENFTVHMAVIENETTGNVGSNGETSFKNVMMKMLPNAQGTNFNFKALK